MRSFNIISRVAAAVVDSDVVKETTFPYYGEI